MKDRFENFLEFFSSRIFSDEKNKMIIINNNNVNKKDDKISQFKGIIWGIKEYN